MKRSSKNKSSERKAAKANEGAGLPVSDNSDALLANHAGFSPDYAGANPELAGYHVPVMLRECLEGLNINPAGTYVDLTFGGGGHSREILKLLTTGKLYAFDTDPEAALNAADKEAFPPKKFTLIHSNFRHLKQYLKMYGVTTVDGILADLGISSHQIDTPERGFSTRFDAPLDMRMGPNVAQSAADLIRTASETQLHRIFGEYGEVTNAKTLAAAVVKARIMRPIETTGQLKDAITPLAPRNREFKYQAQVFQALRIAVNEEMEALEQALLQSAEILKPGGRLVVMSYHSLEDRPVKNLIAKGKIRGEAEKDLFGNENLPFKKINRKPVEASEIEIQANPRARSAVLRIAEKI
ncbi:MAG: 16S rRNA (cytosine(1402)-N(4))-methyltransferase RsmH [Bacteroidota bacterium]